MISKLRKKIILIIMSFISAVLIAVLISLLVSSYQQYKSRTGKVMDMALEMRYNNSMPEFEIGGKMGNKQVASIAFFTVTVDDGGNVIDTFEENVSVSDEVLISAVETVLASGTERGSISKLNLRYQMRTVGEGEKIAFADMSDEISSMRTMSISAGIICFSALLVFFFISIFLSRLAVKPAEQAFSRQQQFIANASHELKTPLTVVLANTEILLTHPKETIGSHEKWIKNTRAEAKRMKGLVEDMLFLAKSDYQEDYEAQDVCLSDIVWNSALPFEAVAYESGITLVTQINQDVMVFGAAERLKQLVAILLDNACKYSGLGEEVVVRLYSEQSKAVLEVANTGVMISQENIAHIFERFYRGDKSRSSGGYGLGLAIAKEIVEKCQGKISVTSNESPGTVFTVKMDLLS